MFYDVARPLAVLAAVALPLTVSACGTGASSASDGRLRVVTSFYPLQFAAEQVGGDLVRVSSLTKPGAEPHDLELTPSDVVSLTKADLVVYEKGFQPAVDDAVAQAVKGTALDVSTAAHLDLYSDETTHTDESAAEDAAHSSADPHFWLDPVKYAAAGEAIAAQLERLDPAHASDYSTRAAGFAGRLHALDAEFAKGVAHCTNRRIVTSHTAFGYFAQRYGFTQEGIAGVSPRERADRRGPAGSRQTGPGVGRLDRVLRDSRQPRDRRDRGPGSGCQGRSPRSARRHHGRLGGQGLL